MQTGLQTIHICAQFGNEELLNLLCEKYAISPSTTGMVYYSNTVTVMCYYGNVNKYL